MDFLTNVLSVTKPTGVWPSIIDAFEGGVGSYLLAIVLITLIVRVILAPFDVFNKRITKKQTDIQAKLQPEIEKIKKQCGNDKALLNQKTSALYKKSGMSLGGSCLFMLAFMAINLTIFFTLFSSLNGISSYKISQEYETLKDSYSNVLNLTDSYYKDNGNFNILNDYENLNFKVEVEGNKTYFQALNKDGEKIYQTEYKGNYENYRATASTISAGDITEKVESFDPESTYTKIKIVDGENTNYFYILTNQITKGETNYTISTEQTLYKLYSSNDQIVEYIYTYVKQEPVAEGETSHYTYLGDTLVTGEVKLSQALQEVAMSEVYDSYAKVQKTNSFLWIGNIWVADSPFQNSVFDFNQFKGKVGANNVEENEEIVYNSFMAELKDSKGRVNGYLILAIISIGVSFLATWLGQLSTRQKNPGQKSNKTMMFIMPLIMGVFAVFYNAVFAIYLIVSQLIAAALAPLSNFIIKKWNEHDLKKEEAKAPVVDYRRK